MPIEFDENAKGSGNFEMKPGTFTFKIDEASPHLSQKGNKCTKLTLLVNNGAPWGDSRCFEYIMAHDDMDIVCDAIGVDYNKATTELWDIEGGTGRAEFVTEDYKGYTNLKVKKYLPKKGPARAGVPSAHENPTYAAAAEDPCPF